MKKILMVFDGTNFSQSTFEFVRQMNERQPVLAVGLFLPQVELANLWSYAAAANASAGAALAIPLLEEEEAETVVQNIEQFERLCQHHDITYRVHRAYTDFALPQLKKESRFADLVILSGELFYKGIGGNQLEFLRLALEDAECPVLIIPEAFSFPDSNILAYDGSEDSVYAIKQFTYIFPELAGKPTLLVHAQPEPEARLPNEDEMVELATQHFKDLTLYRLEINPKKYFATWISERKSAVLVTGSFGRSTFSQLFRKSFALDVIHDHKLPVFVAHK